MRPTTLRSLAAATLLALAASLAQALTLAPYSEQALAAAQQAGQPVAVHFHADWCPTCVNQAKSLDALKTDPQLQAVTVLVADYDKERDLRRLMKVRTQSTLVVFRGSVEKARLGGDTEADKLRAALKSAL